MLAHQQPPIPESFSTPVDRGLLARHAEFPEIRCIDDIRSNLRPDSGIRIFPAGPFMVCRYTISLPETFQTPWDLECRGLIFDAHTGALLSRPFHKFFNLGEREGLNDLSFGQGARVETKLDGSMIGAFIHDSEVMFHTRGGITEHALAARANASVNEIEACRRASRDGISLSFEWTHPDNRVIIPYAETALTLLAARDTVSGEYLDDAADELARTFDLPRPSPLAHDIRSAEDLVATWFDLSARTDIEGGVLVFPDGHRLKLKTRDYLRRHKILANLGNEKHAYRAWLEGVVDDTAAALGGERARLLIDFAKQIEDRLAGIRETLEADVRELNLREMPRASAAKVIQSRWSGALQSAAFAILAGGDPTPRLRTLIEQRIGDVAKREALKAEIGLPDWVQDIETRR